MSMMTAEKIEAFWQDATADDVARVMAGETVEARFRDYKIDDWKLRKLSGWVDGEYRCDLNDCWGQCQVYREPSWYSNKPDPGPEHRLLGKFPDEELKPGDEIWLSSKQWASSHNAETGKKLQQKEVWYRRRIEPVEPEPKHYVLRVGDSVETPSGHRVEVTSRSETQSFWTLTAGDKVTLPNGQTITITAKGFEVTR
jgi:hypothetical protein